MRLGKKMDTGNKSQKSASMESSPGLSVEKRFIIVLTLAIGVWFIFQTVFMKKPAPPQEKDTAGKQSTTTQVPAATPSQASNNTTETIPTQTAGNSQNAAVPQQPEESPTVETHVSSQTITIDTKFFSAVLDNQGAVLTSFILKEYHETSKQPVELIAGCKYPELKEKFGSFFSLNLPSEPDLTAAINKSLFEVQQTKENSSTGPMEKIIFLYQSKGVKVKKEFTFSLQSYLVRFSCQVESKGRPVETFIQLGPGLTTFDLVPSDKYSLPPHLVWRNGEAVDTLFGPKINDDKDGDKKLTGAFFWAGVQTKFFTILAIPETPSSSVTAHNRNWTFKDPNKPAEAPKNISIVSMEFPVASDSAINLFIGPKSYQVLSSVREDLTRTIDYGWFAIIVKPLYYVLRFTQQYVANLGLCIILLTVIITIALFPLRYIQLKNMRQMQKLQPQIQEIQKKYKGKKSAEDRQKMGTETMALYKEAGVNPMSGCIPLLIQFPFLIAFYNLIDKSIEFWHQPFAFWLKDLSAPDPFYITPILMGLSMILQMKQTPATPGQDVRMQKMMMYIMPVMMTIILAQTSSGLMVYFFFSNIFSWGIQKVYELFTAQKNQKKLSDPVKKSKQKNVR